MTDIVEKLRDPSKGSPRWGDTMAEAADEIERLRKEKDEWIGRYQAELDDNHRMIAWYKEACAERDHFGSTADARAVCITMLERERDRLRAALHIAIAAMEMEGLRTIDLRAALRGG